MAAPMAIEAEAPRDCTLCPRLVTYRRDTARKQPTWFNGAVASFGEADAELLIIGLAPGVTGANRTGRPFTGDYAGDLLYATLGKFGFTAGTYAARSDDGLALKRAMITNAVRCVPPENKPTSDEINQCRPFLTARIAALPKLKVMLCLGKISHDSTVRALGLKLSAHPFGHGTRYDCTVSGRNMTLLSSYHCSRYNTNTRRLTAEMFEDVFAAAKARLG
jgi:uracil-DNA glycosylase